MRTVTHAQLADALRAITPGEGAVVLGRPVFRSIAQPAAWSVSGSYLLALLPAIDRLARSAGLVPVESVNELAHPSAASLPPPEADAPPSYRRARAPAARRAAPSAGA